MTISKRDNYTTTIGALAAGTTAGTFKTVQPVNYAINGFGYLKAATDNLTFSGSHTAQVAGQRAAYFIVLDAAGAVTTVQSQVVTASPLGDQRTAAEVPTPSLGTVIGAIVLTGAFTPGAAAALGGLAPVYYNFAGDYSNSIPL